jgi:hypothetical protein
MKAEERKHLTTNSLAESLGHLIEKAKQGPSRRTLIIGGVIALAVILFFTWRYFSRSAEENSSARTVGTLTLMDPDQLQPTLNKLTEDKAQPREGENPQDFLTAARFEAFIKDKANEGTSQARLMRFQLARKRLEWGTRDLGAPRSRDVARDNLTRSAEEYEKLVTEASDSPHLVQEALLNAGKARESLGEYDRAKAHYEALSKKEHEKSAAAAEAALCLARLNDPNYQATLEALANELKKRQ